jgi:hypothetical protein
MELETIPVLEGSKAFVCDRSLAGIAGSIPTGGMDICVQYCLLCVVSATGLSLVQRSLTECGVSEYDREASKWGGPGPEEAVASQKKIELENSQCEGTDF